MKVLRTWTECREVHFWTEGGPYLDRRRRAISGNRGRSHLDRGGAPSAAIKGDRTSSDQAEVVPPSIGAVALLFFLGFALRESVKARCTELMGTSRNSANGAGYLKQGGRRGGHGYLEAPWWACACRGGYLKQGGTQPSAAIGFLQWDSEALGGTWRHTEALRRHSVAIRGTQRRSGALRRTAQGAEACPCS